MNEIRGIKAKPQKSLALLFSALLALTATALAEISSNQAADYLISQNFIAPEESYVEPTTTLTYQNQAYWVFIIKRGTDITAFIPVDAENKVIPESRGSLMALAEAQYIFNSISSLQQTMISRGDWLITAQEQTYYDNLQIFLNDELFELEVISQDAKDPEVSAMVSSVSMRVEDLINKAINLEEEIQQALAFESELRKSPKTTDIQKLDNAYNSIFNKTASIADEATAYDSEVKKLKQAISEADIDSQSKSFLINYSSPPTQIYVLTSKKTKANALKEEVRKIYESDTIISNLVDNLETRFEKAGAEKALTGFDETLNRKGFSSLEEAYNYITNENNLNQWADTDSLLELQTSYAMAKNYFEDKNYSASIDSADKAKGEALNVISGGQKEPEAEINMNLVKTLIYVLAALIVLGVAYSYRDKIKDLFFKGEVKKEDEAFKIKWD